MGKFYWLNDSTVYLEILHVPPKSWLPHFDRKHSVCTIRQIERRLPRRSVWGAPIGPKDLRQLVHPCSFGFSQHFLQLSHYDLVHGLSLTVGLEMFDRAGNVPYPYLLIEVPQLFFDKLAAVVGDDHVREAKAAYDVTPDEGVNLPSGDVSQSLRFHPLGEIVHRHKYEFLLRSANRESYVTRSEPSLHHFHGLDILHTCVSWIRSPVPWSAKSILLGVFSLSSSSDRCAFHKYCCGPRS